MTIAPQIRRILIAKGLRAFGDGFVSLLLPLYLLDLGLRARCRWASSRRRRCCGSGLLTLPVGLHAHRYALPRSLLLAATALMAATGLGFAFVTRFLAAAGDRRRRNAQSVERRRQRVPAARARGAVAAGRRQAAHGRLRALQPRRHARRGGRVAGGRPARDALGPDTGCPLRASLQAMFVLYARAGRCSPRSPTAACRVRANRSDRGAQRAAARIEDARSTRWPRCSASTRSAAASSCSRWSRCGSTSASACRWRQRARIFFWTGVLTAVSYLVAVRIADRIGLVNTMVFTHLPSSLCLIAIPFMPDLGYVDRAAVRAQRAVADGRADAQLLRDGDRARRPSGPPRRASRRCRAASPRRRARSSPASCWRCRRSAGRCSRPAASRSSTTCCCSRISARCGRRRKGRRERSAPDAARRPEQSRLARDYGARRTISPTIAVNCSVTSCSRNCLDITVLARTLGTTSRWYLIRVPLPSGSSRIDDSTRRRLPLS